jgi:hypothetical protein
MDEIPRGVYPALDAGLGMTIPGALVTMIFLEMRTYATLSNIRRRGGEHKLVDFDRGK